MSITLELPADISEAEARLALAIELYREGKLPPGRAAALAGIGRWDFEKVLVEQKIPFPMTEEDLVKEIENAMRHS